MNKVVSGFFALTEITDPARHVDYNWWHASDHQAENLALEGICYAQRWAAPRSYMDARLAVHPSLAPTQYIGHYMATEPLERTIEDFHDLGQRTRDQGRFFPDRNIVTFGFHNLVKGYVADRVEVSPDALPYRPHTGVLLVIKHLLDGSRGQEIAKWHDQVHVPDVLTVKGVTGCYLFQSTGTGATFMTKDPSQVWAGSDTLDTPVSRHVWLYFLDEDPMKTVLDLKEQIGTWRQAGRSLDMTGAMETILASPYQTIDPIDDYDWLKR